ncbi:hypothetical protein [Streptomyces sp. URMC 129]|uniref:hypothetical protein n=1 Tax=Streptomyces sp. URMC 129 TaxID=3423407 RepID=UPI003F19A850
MIEPERMKGIVQRVDALRRDYADRDARHQTVYDARAQRIDNIAPGTMPDAWPKPITANMIDISARQLAENLAPLPSINCSTGSGTSEAAKRRSAKRTKIAYSYIIDSRLERQMPRGCDWYLMYGSMPIVVEPDFKSGRPVLRIDNPMGSYPEWGLNGEIRSYTRTWRETARRLAAKFPMHESAILGKRDATWNSGQSGDTELEVIKYMDAHCVVLYMPERNNLVLAYMDNPFGKVAVAIALKPSYDDQDRGQFDDAVYPFLARNRVAMLGLQATNQAVRAPLALPTDVQKISFGDDAVIRTDSPDKIRRVGGDIPTAAWQQDSLLAEEVMRATRTPRAASGDIDASIITGKGVEALAGGYDIQIRTGQLTIGQAISDAIELAFEMDERFWPEAQKEISGVINGTPFEERYTPSQDIKGSYRVSVSYGFASGMNPNQALIFLLQLRGDQLVPRDFVQQQLPMDMDVQELQKQIDREGVVDALKQGVYAMAASIGVLAQQGMDPTETLAKMAELIKLRDKLPFEEAVLRAFAPKEQPQAAPADPMAALLGGGPGALDPGTGLSPDVAPGQAQLGPGGAPDVMTMLAGLTSSGRPDMRATVSRKVPA